MRFFWESLLLLHAIESTLRSMDSQRLHPKHFDILEFLSNVKPVQNWFYSLAMRFQDRDDRPAVIAPSAKAVTRVCWLSPCLSAAWCRYVLMVFRSSSSAETTQLLSVIWWWCWSTNQTARSIDYTRQSFKTRLPRSLVGIWPINLHNQLLGRDG